MLAACMAYFDNNSTTPPYREVIEAVEMHMKLDGLIHPLLIVQEHRFAHFWRMQGRDLPIHLELVQTLNFYFWCN